MKSQKDTESAHPIFSYIKIENIPRRIGHCVQSDWIVRETRTQNVRKPANFQDSSTIMKRKSRRYSKYFAKL